MLSNTTMSTRELDPTLQTRRLPGLFLAGRSTAPPAMKSCGAGLVAGLNAALAAARSVPVVFDRADGYLGVMIDDLRRAASTSRTGCSLRGPNTA
jgi:tRNA uridine 5-carboxymethylaminomethyl modification enzyme